MDKRLHERVKVVVDALNKFEGGKGMKYREDLSREHKATLENAWELIEVIRQLDKELQEANQETNDAWQRVNDANRELGILLHTEVGCADTWARIGRALRGQQRPGDLSYREPKKD